MFSFRKSAIIGLLGLAAFATVPAKADLIISCTGQTGCGTLATDTSNTFASFSGTLGFFTINQLNAIGVNGTGGNPLLGISAIDVANTGAHGPQTLTINITETNLSSLGTLANFLMNWGSSQVNATVDRAFYVDATNSGLHGAAQFLDDFATSGSNFAQSKNSSVLKSLSGQFSVTEIITITINGLGNLQAGDQISALAVPEPMSLSLLGMGLLALGGMGWRRKSDTNSGT